MKKNRIGRLGEDIAVNHLIQKGYEILERNYRRYRGEIDIIAKKDGVLVFVEVKSARSLKFGEPIFRVTPKKQRQLGKIALAYYQEHELFDQDSRFDVVTVLFRQGVAQVQHIENAFWLEPEE